mmetsp:Transcript_5792/g.10645  ORF Transcript_5792/g.10645 Transcript_5792/m.10645 type:complete len:294 (+) Transcript_5792:90-971(+)
MGVCISERRGRIRYPPPPESGDDSDATSEGEGEIVPEGFHETPVYLNVYDIYMVNSTFRSFGFGVYHTGVQVYDHEYSFAGHERPETGARSFKPRDSSWISDALFYETIFIGNTRKTKQEVSSQFNELEKEFKGYLYSAMHNNCNDFSWEFLCMLDIIQDDWAFPRYISRLRQFGKKLECILPSALSLPIKKLKVRIIDLRTRNETKDTGLLEESVNIPCREGLDKNYIQARVHLGMRSGRIPDDKDIPVGIICSNTERSRLFAEVLRDVEYSNVKYGAFSERLEDIVWRRMP